MPPGLRGSFRPHLPWTWSACTPRNYRPERNIPLSLAVFHCAYPFITEGACAGQRPSLRFLASDGEVFPAPRSPPALSHTPRATRQGRAFASTRCKQGIGSGAESSTCRVDIVDKQNATPATRIRVSVEASCQVRYALRRAMSSAWSNPACDTLPWWQEHAQ